MNYTTTILLILTPFVWVGLGVLVYRLIFRGSDEDGLATLYLSGGIIVLLWGLYVSI